MPGSNQQNAKITNLKLYPLTLPPWRDLQLQYPSLWVVCTTLNALFRQSAMTFFAPEMCFMLKLKGGMSSKLLSCQQVYCRICVRAPPDWSPDHHCVLSW